MNDTQSMSRSKFAEEMQKLRDGDFDAIAKFIETYGPQIRRVIRRRLHKQMRRQFDSLDFAQMIWKSFFNHSSQIVRFDDRQHLIKYLVKMTKYKVIGEYRKQLQTQGRNIMRDHDVDASEVQEIVAGSEATPPEMLAARERWNEIISDESERNQEMIRLRLSGYKYQEIADEMGVSFKTVQRLMDRIFERAFGNDD